MKRVIWLSVFIPSLGFASFFDRHAEGWFWYEELEAKDKKTDIKKPEIPTQPLKQSPSQRMQTYQQKIADSLNLAILEPSEQNLKAYAQHYFETIARAQQFTDAYQLMLLKNPRFDYSLQFPLQPMAQQVYAEQKEQHQEQLIQDFAKTHGFFFFFEGNCQYCHLFAPLVKSFAEKYGIEVLAINLGQTALKEFPNAVLDNGTAQLFKVTHLPSLFAVNPKTRTVIPLAHGAVSFAQLEENVFRMVDYPKRYSNSLQLTSESVHD